MGRGETARGAVFPPNRNGLKRATAPSHHSTQCTTWYVCKEVGPKVPSFGHLDLAAGVLWSWGSQQRGMASR
ncbi:hypothetical protein NEUTE2DRAFT_67186 [Neurospora tetrasperma FGSC 2509]|nr:hypothetical protein NEUTE2DRAFT_67186 [Neurospora tetrasperma FGSC 2509]